MSFETADPMGSAVRRGPSAPGVREFERIYRANVGPVTAYFARRCSDPQDVADLTSETVLEAARSFDGFDCRRGTERGWMFGIARHVFARHCERSNRRYDAALRLAGHRPLEHDEYEELEERIDAQRDERKLLECWAQLNDGERDAIEFVDLMQLSPKEAAVALDVSRGVLRMRLSRARARLKRGAVR